ncbi:MAG: DMT family transporter [Rikenellaceae bacterium]
MTNEKKSHSIIPLAIFTTVLWGTAIVVAKIGFEYLPPAMLSGIRFTLAGLMLFPVVLSMKLPLSDIKKHWRFMVLFGFVQTFLQYGLFFMGLNIVPGEISAIIIGAGPLFIALMAHFALKNDKFTIRKTIAIVLGIAGVVFISLSNRELTTTNPLFYRGVTLLIVSNLVGSYTNIMVVKRDSNLSPVMLTMGANFSGGLMLFVASQFFETPFTPISELPLRFFLALIWLAIIPAAGFSIWYYLLSKPGVKVSELNIWKFIIPVVGVGMSWMFIEGENPNWNSVIGIIIISTSLIVLQFPSSYIKRISKKSQ